jgi:hypothetical protein
VRVKVIKTIPRQQIDLIYQVSCTSIDHIDLGRGVLPRATLAPGALASLATDPGRYLERAKESHPPSDSGPVASHAGERSVGLAQSCGPADSRERGLLAQTVWSAWPRRAPAQQAECGVGGCAPSKPSCGPLFFFFCLLPFCSLSRWSYEIGPLAKLCMDYI